MAKHKNKETIRSAVLKQFRNNADESYRPKQLAKKLGYYGNHEYQLFKEIIQDLRDEGALRSAGGNKLTIQKKTGTTRGVLTVNPRGFGFVSDGEAVDVFIDAAALSTGIDGDTVLVELGANTRRDSRREGRILSVLKRGRTQAVGTFVDRGSHGTVRPDNLKLTKDIYVPQSAYNGAGNRDKVVVSIDVFDNPHALPEGRILSVIGHEDDPTVRVTAIALGLDIQIDFSADAEAEASFFPDSIPESEIARRIDMRAQSCFTIDPPDAKDFDDAVFVEKIATGWRASVHIADVSHYVPSGSNIDREAYIRGTSVYLVDRAIPMLPHRLSSDLCSLKPGVDRLAMSCIVELDDEVKVVDYRIAETVINSKARLTYDEAQAILDGSADSHPLDEHVRVADRLSQTLTTRRIAAGAVDFDMPEVEVELDETGVPVNIRTRKRSPANRLIEELMLLANRTVAESVGRAAGSPPFVYRIHDRPDADRISQLASYVRVFGFRLDGKSGETTPGAIQELLNEVSGTDQEIVVRSAVLRAMARAKYSVQNIGHFGLGFDMYTHFTSPIRRYPDLIAHRLLKLYESDGPMPDIELLSSQCDHCSEREQVATEAERESVKLKQVEYASRHLGDHFKGVVAGVSKFGVYVEIGELLVEGMVHVRDMGDDYYEYDPDSYTLYGRSSGRKYRPGDPVEVVIVGADTGTRQIDLFFV